MSFCGMMLELIGLKVGTCFGTLSCIQFVSRTPWFGMPHVCGVKGERVEHAIKDHEVHDDHKV